MTNSEPEKTEMQKVVERTQAGDPGEVLGVLTGQVPVRSMPIAEDSRVKQVHMRKVEEFGSD